MRLPKDFKYPLVVGRWLFDPADGDTWLELLAL